jgi:SNF2 family DNA or RNA helicase
MPDPEGLTNFFTQMCFVNGGSFMGFRNFWGWRDALFMPVGYDWIPRRAKGNRPSTRDRIKQAVGELSFAMTRKEAKVGSKLFTETRTVPMNADQRRAFKQVQKKFAFRDIETKSSGAQHVWLQRIAGGFSPDRDNPEVLSSAKYNEIIALLETELKGESLVIWFHFNEELAYVYHNLKAAGYAVSALLGGTSLKRRYRRIDRFARGADQVICVQEKLGLFGLDLSRADTEVYYSNAWGYEERTQSQDRLVHPKKTTPLLAIDLVTEGTTDEDVVETLQEKGVSARSFQNKLLERIRQRMNADYNP